MYDLITKHYRNLNDLLLSFNNSKISRRKFILTPDVLCLTKLPHKKYSHLDQAWAAQTVPTAEAKADQLLSTDTQTPTQTVQMELRENPKLSHQSLWKEAGALLIFKSLQVFMKKEKINSGHCFQREAGIVTLFDWQMPMTKDTPWTRNLSGDFQFNLTVIIAVNGINV